MAPARDVLRPWWWVDKVVREIPFFSATFLYEKDSPGFKDLTYERAVSSDIVVTF
jgi:hypothetical protein